MMKLKSLALGLVLSAAASCAIAQGVGQLGAGQVWGNPTAAQRVAAPSSLTAMLDRAFGATRGAIIERGVSGWGIVAPSSTVGLGWVSNGAGADPSYQVLPLVGGGTGANTAAGARTNLGVAIGSNVEAWDADLDCLAAISATGVIHRTGAGTCGASAVALADLAAGTQDTVIGYFGSTASAAAALPNCTSALIYSTTTHLFTCNTLAGAGNVSNSGSPVTGQIAQWISPTTVQGVNMAAFFTPSGLLNITGTLSPTLDVTAATKAVQQAGSSNAVAVTPLHQQDHDSALKAWASINGTTGALLAGYNVASVSHTPGTGVYQVTFTTSFGSGAFACTTTSSSSSSGGYFSEVTTRTASTVQIETFNTAPSTGVDASISVDIICAGRQ